MLNHNKINKKLKKSYRMHISKFYFDFELIKHILPLTLSASTLLASSNVFMVRDVVVLNSS